PGSRRKSVAAFEACVNSGERRIFVEKRRVSWWRERLGGVQPPVQTPICFTWQSVECIRGHAGGQNGNSVQKAWCGTGIPGAQMKKGGKMGAWVLAVLATVAVAAISSTIGWRPFIGPRSRKLTARKFDSTPARLTRGDYLVNHVTDCMGCHAEHDWTNPEAPIL